MAAVDEVTVRGCRTPTVDGGRQVVLCAELVLLWGRSGEIPVAVRDELEATLERHGPRQIPGTGE